MKYLEIIEKLHPDIIHHFLSTGECQGIPAAFSQADAMGGRDI